MNIYENIIPINKQEAELAFSSTDVEKICNAMVSIAFFEQDWKWAQDKFLSFLENSNSVVSGLAATCLGHLARIHRNLEKVKVVEALRTQLKNPDIAGRIHDALADIQQFA